MDTLPALTEATRAALDVAVVDFLREQEEDKRANRMAALAVAYAVSGSLTRSCALARTSEAMHRSWLAQSAAYSELFLFAGAVFASAAGGIAERAEAAAIARAIDGWDEPVYQGGELVGVRRRFSDSLLERVLSAYGGERWAKAPAGTTVNVGLEVSTAVNVASVAGTALEALEARLVEMEASGRLVETLEARMGELGPAPDAEEPPPD